MKTFFSGTFVLAASAALAQALDLVPFGSTWEYMHPTDGVDPAVLDTDFDATWYLGAADFATTYNGPSFSTPAAGVDAGSGAAPVGYDTVTYINNTLGGLATTLTKPGDDLRYTAYLRQEFNVAADVDDLGLEIIADDAAVIYIDGVFWQAINFTGVDTYTAGTTDSADENLLVALTVDLGGLSAGEHTIAVSVHQQAPDSTDLGFDMRLTDGGTESAIFGFVDLGGAPTDFLLDGSGNDWLHPGGYLYELNDGDGGTIVTEQAGLGGTAGALFVMDFTAFETSNSTNFEPGDSFAASVEFDDGGGGLTTASLVPPGLDTDMDDALNGGEFGADIPTSGAEVDFFRPLVVEVPDGTQAATVSVSAINDSGSEHFEFRAGRFVPAPVAVLGAVDFGAPGDIDLLFASDGWTNAVAGEFVMMSPDGPSGIVSKTVDLTGMPQARVGLTLNVDETSSTSNFEDDDWFAAWVEVVDSLGGRWKVELVDGGLDTGGDHRLAGEDYAPGADASDMLNIDIPLAARLPADAVSAQIVIVGLNDGSSETFTVSDVSITAAPPVSGDFAITEIVPDAGGGYKITWQSDTGNTYDLQFSPDAREGSYTEVGNFTATGSSSSLTHDPGAGVIEGVYRVSRRP